MFLFPSSENNTSKTWAKIMFGKKITRKTLKKEEKMYH